MASGFTRLSIGLTDKTGTTSEAIIEYSEQELHMKRPGRKRLLTGQQPGEKEVSLIKAPNGAVVNAEVLKSISQAAYIEKTVQQVADNIWVIGGYSVANCAVFKTPRGLVVFDTGDSAKEGKLFREVIESQISKEPIIAIIYSHSHYALGG